MKYASVLAALIATASVIAQDDRPAPDRPGADRPAAATPGMGGAPMVVRLADADKNGEVSADEWKSFLGSVKSETEGHADLAKIKSAFVYSIFDKDGDKSLTTKDLKSIFGGLDKNGDKTLSREELGTGGFARMNREEVLEKYDADGDGQLNEEERRVMQEEMAGGRRGRRGEEGGEGREAGEGRAARAAEAQMAETAFVRRADADKNGEVTADEYTKFIDGLGADDKGVVPMKAMLAALQPPRPEGAQDDRGGRGAERGRAGGLTQMLDRTLDADGDGKVPNADLDRMFTTLDRNKDKTIQAEELRPRMPERRGRGEGEEGDEGDDRRGRGEGRRGRGRGADDRRGLD